MGQVADEIRRRIVQLNEQELNALALVRLARDERDRLQLRLNIIRSGQQTLWPLARAS